MKRRLALLSLLSAAVALAAVAGVAFGATPLPLSRILELLFSSEARSANPTDAWIVLNLRLCRVVAAGLAGAALSVAGAVLQALLRNPLAEPYVLGVSAGASVGAAAVVAFGFTAALGGLALPTAAFLGALASTALVYALARSGGRIPGPTLLLSGVVVASVLGSLVSVLLFLSGGQNRMEAVILWTMGGFSEVDWARVAISFVPILVCAVVMWALGRDLNLLAFGEDPARFLGADVEPLKVTALIATALLTACAVAMGGVIGFVGLMAPHAARRLVGPDHRILIPSTALLGAVLLILGDLLGRSVHPPLEIPVGLITALFGGPFFLVVLRGQFRRSGS